MKEGPLVGADSQMFTMHPWLKKDHESKQGLTNFSNCVLNIQHVVTVSNMDVFYHNPPC